MLFARAYIARRWWSRAIGLLGTRALGSDEVLWIPRCRVVHTVGMAGPIACAFVDRTGVVIRVADPVPPWRIVGTRGARAVIEGPAGLGTRLRPGDPVRRPG